MIEIKQGTGELRVYYEALENESFGPIDEAIENALKPLGFVRWASGINLETRVRDIAFDRK